MSTLTSNSTVADPMAKRSVAYSTIRIVPPRGWFDLGLKSLWDSRELALLFRLAGHQDTLQADGDWRGLGSVQPFMTMVVSAFSSANWPRCRRMACLTRSFFTALFCPGRISPTRVQAATATIVENQRVITKVYFPRLLLPISATLSGLVDFSIGFIVLLIFVLSYGFRLGWTILFIPFFLVLVILTVLGVGLWLSALNALYRDVRYSSRSSSSSGP